MLNYYHAARHQLSTYLGVGIVIKHNMQPVYLWILYHNLYHIFS
jgi:hypothetical protein